MEVDSDVTKPHDDAGCKPMESDDLNAHQVP